MDKTMDALVKKLEKTKILDNEEEYMNLHLATLLDMDELTEDELVVVLNSAAARYKRYLENKNFKKAYLLERRAKEFLRQFDMHKISDAMLFQFMKQTDMVIIDFIAQNEKLEPHLLLGVEY